MVGKPDGNNMSILYTPAEVSKSTLKTIDEIQQQRDSAVRVTIPGLSEQIKVLRPGRLFSIIALPSNWKTGLMQAMARAEAERLDPTGNEAVIYATWEVAIEELGIYDLANTARLDVSRVLAGEISKIEFDQLRAAAIKRAALPIYVLGHSIADRRKRQHMTMTAVAQALGELEDQFGIKPRLSCLDYLQRIKPENTDAEPRMQFAQNVDRAKDMSIATGAPVLLGCQAKQDVAGRDIKLPRMSDGRETSNIADSSDGIITLWRPYVTEGADVEFELFGQQMTARKDLVIIHVAKNKFGDVGGWWPVRVDFASNRIMGLYDFRSDYGTN
jgi:replicative DNA helicase